MADKCGLQSKDLFFTIRIRCKRTSSSSAGISILAAIASSVTTRKSVILDFVGNPFHVLSETCEVPQFFLDTDDKRGPALFPDDETLTHKPGKSLSGCHPADLIARFHELSFRGELSVTVELTGSYLRS